jgi:hypothetical protein
MAAGSTPQGTVQASRSGTSISISWSATPAGQKLQSATDINGPWTEIPGASNPYTFNATGQAMFFRTVK